MVPTIIIAPPSNRTTGIVPQLQELWTYRYLLRALVLRELRLRYKNSALGIVWSMALPLIQVFSITIVVGYILSSGPSNLSAYVLCAFLPWTFFQTSVLDSASSILSYSYMLKKVYFPREILPLVSICANFVHFLIALGVFLVYRYIITPFLFGWPGPPPREISLLPIIVLVEFFFICGVSFFVSALNVFYEDVKFLVTAGMTIFFYFVPIMYFAENIFFAPRIPATWHWKLYHVYLLNPLAWLVTAFKQIFFQPQIISNRGAVAAIKSAPFDYRYFAITTAASLLVFVLGYLFFNSRKWKFAERP